MMEALRWVFGGFWRFIGVSILIGILFGGVAEIIHPTPDCVTTTTVPGDTL